MKKRKDIFAFLGSMQFAFILLGIEVLVCIAGSILPQGETASVYQQSYPSLSGLILALGLDDVFHVWWFVVLTAEEKITVADYSIIILNPQSYSLIQVKRDPFTWLAGLGALILLAALVIAFYLRTEELWAIPGDDGTWMVYGKSRKGSLLYQEKLLAPAEHYQRGETT